MKSVVILFFVCAIIGLSKSFTPEQRKEFEDKLVNDCAQKEGATADDLATIAHREIPNTRVGKCVHACFIETLGLAKDNKVSVEGAVEIAKLAFSGDESKVKIAREISEECADVTDPDRCEFAIKMMDCGMKAAMSRNVNFKDML